MVIFQNQINETNSQAAQQNVKWQLSSSLEQCEHKLNIITFIYV